MAQWLVKEEPEHYSYDQLVKERKTVWAGVRNPLAQKHLRSIRKGDRIFYYHTGKEKAIVAIASAASDAYPDPPLVRMSRLSVMPVTDQEWARIERIAG
jgi:predicted RNA-binding protein with PUA-like domain